MPYPLTVIEYECGPGVWQVYCTVRGCTDRVAELVAEAQRVTGRPARAL